MHERHSHRRRPWARLVRILLLWGVVLNLTGLADALEEVVEDTVHRTVEGHSAHAEHHPEGEPPSDQEHDCHGVVHHCGCCPSLSASLTSTSALPPEVVGSGGPMPTDDTIDAAGVRRRVERPPAA